MYGIGDILGSGIYGLIGKAAGQLGNFVWLGFLVSFFVALMTGICYAALGSRYPRAAGSSFVIWKAFGSPFLAFITGLATLASGLTSMAAAARVFAGYFTGVFTSVSEGIAILIFCLLLTEIVLKGIRESMWANSAMTFIEVSGLLAIIVAGLPYLGSVNLADMASLPTGVSLSPSLVLSGAVLTFYSFIGFEDLINVSEEVQNPERNLPIGLLLSLLISSGIYMLVAMVAVSVIPAAELAQSKQPLVDVIARAWPWFPTKLFSFIALFAVSNTALLNFIMGSRLVYGLGNLGLLPQFVSKVHERTKTPYVSILLVGGVFMTLAYAGDVASLARATSLFILLIFMAMCASLFHFQRWEKGEVSSGWRVPQFIPVLGVFGTAIMMFHSHAADLKIAGTLLALIVILFLIKRPTSDQIERFESEVECHAQ
jgi:APA family basic amino acid/polyamine antiporter